METKVTNYLDSLGISYKILPHKNSVYICEDAARERNVPLNEMIKTANPVIADIAQNET